MQNHGSLKRLMSKLNWNSEELSVLEKELVDLDQVFDQSPDGIIMINQEFNVLRINPTFRKMAQMNETNVRGMKCYDLFNSILCHTDRCPLYTIMGGEGSIEIEANKTFSTGVILPTLITAKPLRNPAGEVIGIVEFIRDITQMKASEQAITQLEEHIQKMEKLEAVGILAGGIAHDFNNYLTAILGSLSLARNHLQPLVSSNSGAARAAGMLNEAERASLQARSLTQQLLTFAKGGIPVLRPISLGQFLHDSAGFALSGSTVRCRFEIEENLWIVEIDEGQFSQVIHNLVINADQAMPNGGTISISASNLLVDENSFLSLEKGRYVMVTVADKGVGIIKEHLDKIFDPYFTTKQKGSGLGLATSFSVIMKHKGYITVESQVGLGTTFRIYLPASETHDFTKTNHLKIRNVSGRGKILIMDDDQMVGLVLKEMLEYLGYETANALDGQQAIETYMAEKMDGRGFDAVIMDLTIPGGMGGREAIGILKELDPQVKAIVSSGYSNDPVMGDYKSYGFQAVLTKPFGVEEIEEVLTSIMVQ